MSTTFEKYVFMDQVREIGEQSDNLVANIANSFIASFMFKEEIDEQIKIIDGKLK